MGLFGKSQQKDPKEQVSVALKFYAWAQNAML